MQRSSTRGTRLLVVGGDAAGMSAAAQARRLLPDLEIVVVEKGRWTSYSACGIPYLVQGSVHAVDDLMVRTPDELRAVRIDIRTGHEVVALDLAARRAEVHNLAHGRSFHLGFDELLLATGSRPARPDRPGFDLPHVHAVAGLEDAARLVDGVRPTVPSRVAVVGSDSVGLRMAEAFRDRGAEVTVVEAGPEVMPALDPELSGRVAKALREAGIAVQIGAEVTAVDETGLHTDAGEIRADLVVLGGAPHPNSDLGRAVGLPTGVGDALVVDRRQRTSVEGVWAAGDCCQSVHRVSGGATYQPLGPVANKQGRVAGTNLAGGYATFPGVLGTAVARVCGLEVGRTGLGEEQATGAGFEAVSVTVDSTTAAGYLPGSGPITVKLLGERCTGRLLGAQVTGGQGSAKRVDVVAAALAGGLDVEQLIGLDLGYAPQFGPVWDPLQTAARVLASRL